jgi:hypothetical protein
MQLSTRACDAHSLAEIEAAANLLAIQAGPLAAATTSWVPELGDSPANVADIRQMMERRLDIARKGLCEAQKYLKAGDSEQAGLILEKVDEDLYLLRRRLGGEFEKAEALSVGL